MSSKTLAFALAMSLAASTGCKRAPAPKPNVLLITVDTLRADRLGCYGYERARTPHTDRLASEGVRVDRAIAPTPLTLPSHTSILTGLEPPAHSVRGNGVFRVPETVETLAEVLEAEGYQTQAFVSADVLHRRFNLDQGFDGYDDEMGTAATGSGLRMRERSGERTMDRVVDWLDARTKSASPAPFFLWVHLFDPHAPYEPPEADAKLAATPYDGEIASVDRQLGRLIDTLEPNGVLNDTILVYTSDHGESLGEHQEATHAVFIYEATQHVPLIFRYPRKLPAGQVYEGPVRSVDIMPTILGLAGKQSAETQGADLSEAFSGQTPAAPRVQYSESLYPELIYGMAHLEGVREDAWTYIRAPRPELYDRSNDPGELRNLLEGGGSRAAKARAAELEASLDRVIEDSKRFASVAEANPLDPDTVAMLQALGYMGDSGAPEDLGGIDPKDGIGIVNEVSRAMAQPNAGDCVAVMRSVLKRLPGYVYAWNGLAECEQRAGNTDAARDAYLKSLAHEPKQPGVYLQLGNMDLSRGNTDGARRHFAEALEIMPDLVDAILAMAKVDVAERQWDEAIRHYKRAIDADPKRADAYLLLAGLYFRNNDFAEARRWYENTLPVAPEKFTYIVSLRAGMSALRVGDPGGAEPHLRRASEAQPGAWQPLYHLACAEFRRGEIDGALDALEAAAARGFANASALERDPCLSSLATEPRFQALVRSWGGGGPR